MGFSWGLSTMTDERRGNRHGRRVRFKRWRRQQGRTRMAADRPSPPEVTMKAFRTALLLGAFLTASVAFADSMSINQFTPRVLPVLVQVDSHGQVREVSSSVALSPQYDRMLRQTLDQMITQPAKD